MKRENNKLNYLEGIRLASPEEVEAIRADSELDPRIETTVLKFKDNTAVVKRIVEVDPFFFNESDKQKLLFTWGIENVLRFMGVPAYYFNVPVKDETFHKFLDHWGAQRTSKEPEYRYKKAL